MLGKDNLVRAIVPQERGNVKVRYRMQYLVSPKITGVPVRKPLFSTISLNPNIRKFGLDGVVDNHKGSLPLWEK